MPNTTSAIFCISRHIAISCLGLSTACQHHSLISPTLFFNFTFSSSRLHLTLEVYQTWRIEAVVDAVDFAETEEVEEEVEGDTAEVGIVEEDIEGEVIVEGEDTAGEVIVEGAIGEEVIVVEEATAEVGIVAVEDIVEGVGVGEEDTVTSPRSSSKLPQASLTISSLY